MAPGTGELASVSDGVATAYFIEHLNYFLASLIPDTNPVFEAWGTGTLAFIGANRYSGGWAWNDGNPWQYMTGLLHEGKFHVRDLLEPAIFGSLPWAYVMCNWAQILLHWRH